LNDPQQQSVQGLQYYVYYKIDASRVEEARSKVAALFREIHSATGIQGQWQRRRDDPGTFMETYLGVTDTVAFERSLNAALEKTGFADLGIARITEIFQCA
jgi:hypothetical protein